MLRSVRKSTIVREAITYLTVNGNIVAGYNATGKKENSRYLHKHCRGPNAITVSGLITTMAVAVMAMMMMWMANFCQYVLKFPITWALL